MYSHQLFQAIMIENRLIFASKYYQLEIAVLFDQCSFFLFYLFYVCFYQNTDIQNTKYQVYTHLIWLET